MEPRPKLRIHVRRLALPPLFLSFRGAEDLLAAQRGITVTYETIRQWCQNFGLDYARRLRRRRGRMGDTWYLDELFVTIQGQQRYIWRAVDQDGVQRSRYEAAGAATSMQST